MGSFRGATCKHEAPITIAAFDKAAFVNFQPNSWMAECCASGNVTGPIASDAAGLDGDGFGGCAHDRGPSKRRQTQQASSEIGDDDLEGSGILSVKLVGGYIECPANAQIQHTCRADEAQNRAVEC